MDFSSTGDTLRAWKMTAREKFRQQFFRALRLGSDLHVAQYRSFHCAAEIHGFPIASATSGKYPVSRLVEIHKPAASLPMASRSQIHRTGRSSEVRTTGRPAPTLRACRRGRASAPRRGT